MKRRENRNDAGRPGLAPSTLAGLWVMLIGLVGGAYIGLPIYMESLERRIVFRAPDCMDVAQQQATATPVDVSERGDSLQAWMMGCLEERQAEMARHADLVGFGTMGTLITLSVILTALILQAIWPRLDAGRRGRE